jgi:D-alanyl-D-alanine endopeptidase (penicillin-binding protein 7)
MVNAAIAHPAIREYTLTVARGALENGRLVQYNNSNRLVGSALWEIGLSKTGYISEAGRCLVLQATIAAKPVIIVLLDSLGTVTRFADADRIKRWIEKVGTAPSRMHRM